MVELVETSVVEPRAVSVVELVETEYPRSVNRQSEDDAWRAIVENYGEQPPAPAPAAEEPEELEEEPDPEPDDFFSTDDVEEERFVPPPPPPIPRASPERLAAWLGLFVGPAVMLVCTIFSIYLPALISYLLIAWFVGGFVFLVLHMSNEPRDPWDNGARL